MLQKIESYIKEYHMIRAGSHVIAGVSGGADSVCMLLVLLKLRERIGHTVSVVHVEHGIRGEAGLADAEFVRDLCAREGIVCHICHCRVPEYAEEHGMGEEEAGRHLRYAFFEEEKQKYPDREVRIAVAHNLNDLGETMLFHLARGTGISGLAGIAPVRGDIIRPLLSVDRDEIQGYLAGQHQAYCQDATNGSDRYSRNRIRHMILPVLKQVNRQALGHMYQTAVELRQIDAYLAAQAKKETVRCIESRQHGIFLDKERFQQVEPALQNEVLYQVLAGVSGTSRDITKVHVRQLLELFDRQSGRWICLPYGITARRVYRGVELSRQGTVEGKEPLGQGTSPGIEGAEGLFSFRIVEKDTDRNTQISKKKYTKCFDYDKIKDSFCVRKRLPGDYLMINDLGERQKLKNYLVNAKIPAQERSQIWLLADGCHIMWVVGYRISSYYKVDGYTRKILEVTFNGGKEDEGACSCDVL